MRRARANEQDVPVPRDAPRRRPGPDRQPLPGRRPGPDRQPLPRRRPGPDRQPLPRRRPGPARQALPGRCRGAWLTRNPTMAAGKPRQGSPAALSPRDKELAGSALSLRDQALAALDAGDPRLAVALAEQGLTALSAAHLLGGPDEAAVLIARAEIEEALDRFAAARASAARAIALLGGKTGPGAHDGDCLLLWCQAQERLGGLERLAGDYDGAAARLIMVLDVGSAAFGESSPV